MRAQLLMAAILIYFFEMIFSLIASGRWLLGGEMNIINAFASFTTVTFSAGGGWEIISGIAGFFNAIVNALQWDAPFLSNEWCFFIKLPLYLISIALVWEFRREFISVIQGLVGTIRNLIPGV